MNARAFLCMYIASFCHDSPNPLMTKPLFSFKAGRTRADCWSLGPIH